MLSREGRRIELAKVTVGIPNRHADGLVAEELLHRANVHLGHYV
jgi:hypothetical protein